MTLVFMFLGIVIICAGAALSAVTAWWALLWFLLIPLCCAVCRYYGSLEE